MDENNSMIFGAFLFGMLIGILLASLMIVLGARG